METKENQNVSVVFWSKYFPLQEEVLMGDFLNSFSDYVEKYGDHQLTKDQLENIAYILDKDQT